LESDWEIKNGERKLKIGVIPQPVSFKKEDETATRKRKANPKYSTDESPAPKLEKDKLNDELLKARLEISRKEYEYSQLKRQNQRLTMMLEKVFNKDQICGIGKFSVQYYFKN
jgi:cell shape-determining protein MreC